MHRSKLGGFARGTGPNEHCVRPNSPAAVSATCSMTGNIMYYQLSPGLSG